jgi:enterochelin esterase-like enzyme
MLYKYDQWDRLGADEAADELISSGEAAPFLIFMPFEEQTTANPFEDGFGDAITGGLIPYVEKNFPVCDERFCRAIGGLSRGAGWAVHIGLSKPQYFGSIGAHSLPPFIGDLAAAPRWLAVIPETEMPRVYIDIGIADSGMSPATQFEHILTAYNVPHEWYINNGEHTEEYWSSHVKDYLRWYAKGWQPVEPPVILP